jgi:CubicO group peptidase (beta-lactamase class C family)
MITWEKADQLMTTRFVWRLLCPAFLGVAVFTTPSSLAQTPVAFNSAQAALDVDSSGGLTEREAPAMHRRYFAAADVDRSGELSPREFHDLLGSLLAPRIPDGQRPPPAPKLVTASAALAWSDIDAYISRMVETLPLEGATIVVLEKSKLVHQQSYGLYDEHTQIPIASATKWLNAAMIMTLVDEGKLSLDAPISTYLSWAEGPMGKATLRQMLSHTAGFGGGHLADQARTLSLEESARDAFARPSRGAPGEAFLYGGISMQIAGYIAEKVSGQPYAELFEQRIAGPLGMTQTYIGFAQKREPRAAITNPIAAAGGYSTAADYARFLEMLAGRGVFRGKQILSAGAIDQMFRDYTGRSARLGAATSVGESRGYGIGAWCNQIETDGRCSEVQSGGAFGVSPTVIVEDEVVVLLMVKDRMPLIRDHWQEVSNAIRQILRRS